MAVSIIVDLTRQRDSYNIPLKMRKFLPEKTL